MSETLTKPEPSTKASVSMPPKLLGAAQKRARQQKRSLSAHIQYLLEKDLKGTGLEVREQESAPV